MSRRSLTEIKKELRETQDIPSSKRAAVLKDLKAKAAGGISDQELKQEYLKLKNDDKDNISPRLARKFRELLK